MIQRTFSLMAGLFVLALVLAACPPATPVAPAPVEEPPPQPVEEPTPEPEVEAEEPFRVGFVYVGAIGDLGWTYAHDQGRLALEEHFGDQVETSYVETVSEADAERVIRDFARRGYDLIITTSFGFMDPTETVAMEFPETWFVHISGFKEAPNMSNVFGRIEEPRFVSGIVAGLMTETNEIGYVAAHPIPEVVRGINAFALGVREVNPDARVRVVWTNTWFNPPVEREAAEALLDEGVDVIAQHQDTAEPQRAAEERGVYSVGYNTDMRDRAPGAVLVSPMWNWGVKYIDIVERIMEGTYEPESYWGGWADGIVTLSDYGDMVPDDVRAVADEWAERFRTGEADIFTIFTGPIYDNEGNLRVAEGESLTAEQLLGPEMNWFVENVIGTVPS